MHAKHIPAGIENGKSEFSRLTMGNSLFSSHFPSVNPDFLPYYDIFVNIFFYFIFLTKYQRFFVKILK